MGNFLVIPSVQTSKLKINETSYHTTTSAGSVTTYGDCTGTEFSDPYGTWNRVEVQAMFKITLQEHYATVHLNTDKIKLRSGVICTLPKTYCIGMEERQTFWSTLPNDVCNLKKYEVIYERPANKTHDNTTENSETLYSLTTNEMTFNNLYLSFYD